MGAFVCAGVAQGQSNCLVSSGSGVQILPPAPAFSMSYQVRPADSGRYPSGQRGQTVNLLAYAFGGSNPPLPTTVAGAMRPGRTEGGLREARVAPQEARVAPQSGGNSSAVERQPSKLGVAGSNPVSRSRSRVCAHVAQSVERVLGKDEVSGSIPDMGSRIYRRASAGGAPAPRRPAARRTLTAGIATANGRA